MKLEYISHSCYAIETTTQRIVFDPWISASAYNKQWHLHPPPVNTNAVTNADAILISHGHEDHLNKDSLLAIQKNAHVLFPFQWRKGIKGYFNHLGFHKITEAVSFKKYSFDGFEVTYLGYSLESVIVVETDGNVIVNINDALNSNHETSVEFLLDKIKTRWSKIDYLLSGWSGAGYFPNKVHYKNKDDIEVARLREQYFANNFCRFTKYLQPDVAIAFAPGFVLLNNDNRWINEIKFPRDVLDSYYRENFESDTGIFFPIAYPGDYLINKVFYKTSSYQSDKDLYKHIDVEYKEEIEAANRMEFMEEDELGPLHESLCYWLRKNKSIYHEKVIDDAIFSVNMKDVRNNPYFNIRFAKGIPEVTRSNCRADDSRVLIETKANLLSLNFKKIWGGDLLSIGYGIDVTLFDELSLEKNLDIVCVRLISRFPNFHDDFISNSARILKYYLSNPSLTNLWITQKLKLRPYINKYPFNERDHWITYKKCDLCKVCKMAEVDFDRLVHY